MEGNTEASLTSKLLEIQIPKAPGTKVPVFPEGVSSVLSSPWEQTMPTLSPQVSYETPRPPSSTGHLEALQTGLQD